MLNVVQYCLVEKKNLSSGLNLQCAYKKKFEIQVEFTLVFKENFIPHRTK